MPKLQTRDGFKIKMSSETVEAKVALVTGSSSGIGAAAVRQLAREGFKVAVCGSKQEKVDKVCSECAKLSPKSFEPFRLVLDFSVPENGELAVKKTIEHFGRLDLLVNNAGIFMRTNGNDPATYELYRQVMTINTDATVRATLAAVDELRRTHGNLLFVSSVASIKASESGYAYCMSKAAMSSLAKCLAIDLAPNVRVNIVSPGPVKTPIFERVGLNEETAATLMANTTLQNRIGQIEEIADAICFLASDKASFITGHELFIDGGYLIKPSMATASQQILSAVKKQ